MLPVRDQSSCVFPHRQSLFCWMASRTYLQWVLSLIKTLLNFMWKYLGKLKVAPADSAWVKMVAAATWRVASSRHSVSQGAVQKTAREKIKKSVVWGSERMPVGKLNKRSFRYTRIRYTLWLVNFDRFCQHSRITDADEIIYTIWRQSETFQRVTMVACLALEAVMKHQVEQLNTIGVAATAMHID